MVVQMKDVAERAGVSVFSGPGRKFVYSLAPPLVVGAEDIDTALAMIDARLSEIA